MLEGDSQTISIGPLEVGHGRPCRVIAEIGVNHNGELDTARRLIDYAAECGVDVVKFQTFKASSVATVGAPKAAYQLARTDRGECQHGMLSRLELGREDHVRLMEHARSCGLVFLSTPYSEDDADFLESLGVEAFKVGSGQVAEPYFLAHLAAKGLPMLVSTGMCDLEEVRRAVAVIRNSGNPPLMLFQCTTQYPSAQEDAHLRAMVAMAGQFDVVPGYSDHTEGLAACMAAVALGACMIERHFTLDRNQPGPDHAASSDPVEMARLVRRIREVERCLGSPAKRPVDAELALRSTVRRGVYAACDLPIGRVLTRADMVCRRPVGPTSAAMLPNLIGRCVKQAIFEGEPVEDRHLAH
ncbi:MAG: N-acetylneuraminate synthase family protein [Phycisphaeraceae bacterium]|nr:N-acetylneuraminate synthase family protein [Phycisphaeraceae bacterium]